MNLKRFIGATVVLVVFLYFYEWLIHGVLLMNTYNETPNLWRPMQQMQSMMSLSLLFRVLMGGWFTYIFTKFHKDGGVENGLRFGCYLGIFAGIMAASTFMWLPISAKLAWAWFINNIVQFVAGGAIIGSIYRK
ncbi:MAG: hypothetical protein JSR58_00390 [Verrucomicrobia bacterium]|nr:hypothetical protein [Verrucomicrobiota bacterium]